MSKHAAAAVPKVPGIDLNFRPHSYFGPLPLATHVLARVTGHHRREILRARIVAGEESLPPELIASTLDDDLRDALGMVHPALMGGEYLPRLRNNDIEIARVSLASTTADQISIRARRRKDCIAYRIDDEYPEERGYYKARPATSKLPLTLGELVALLDAGCSGGVVFAPLGYNACPDFGAERLRDFVSVSSEFYPQLGAYYAKRIDRWIESWLAEQSTAGESA